MKQPASATTWATTALLLAALCGCSGTDDQAGPTPSPSPSSSAAPTDSEVASEAASTVVREYVVVLDDVRQHPSKPLNVLATVATSSQLASQQAMVRSERRDGLRQTGSTKVVDLKVQSVNLDNSASDSGKSPTVMVDVCWDVRNADLVDEHGESVVSPDRADVGWTRYTVANHQWADNPQKGWRVATGETLKQAPCAAS